MIWTADTVMYDGVSMDRAYSGSTLIWCKNCPGTQVVMRRGAQVLQGESLLAGEDYMIGFSDIYSSGYLTKNLDVRYVGGLYDDLLVLHCDKNYPAVYESLCEGYVTDIGAAFGIKMSNTSTRHHDYGLIYDPNNKVSLSTYIGYDWKNPHYPDRNVIMRGNYGLQAYYLYTQQGTYNDVGFDLFPLNTGTAYQTLYLYHIEYSYQ